jgi:hypothetical protein
MIDSNHQTGSIQSLLGRKKLENSNLDENGELGKWRAWQMAGGWSR